MKFRTFAAAAVLSVMFGPAAWAQPFSAAPAPAPAPSPHLTLAFNPDGTVSLAAANVTVPRILAEWKRLCGCYVINAEKLTGAPLTVPIQFDHAPQATVLASLLRQAAGFVLTPKRADSTGASDYETIYILASTNPNQNVFSPATLPAIEARPIVTPGSADDEIPPVVPQPAAPQPAASSTQTPPHPNANPYGTPGGMVPASIVPVGRPLSGPAPGSVTPVPNSSR